MDALRKAIVEMVEEEQGIKATELIPQIAIRHPELIIVLNEMPDTLEQLVHEGELVEVEYVLHTMNYKSKSWYLPKGTEVIVRDGRPR
jgi:hypothetical protein